MYRVLCCVYTVLYGTVLRICCCTQYRYCTAVCTYCTQYTVYSTERERVRETYSTVQQSIQSTQSTVVHNSTCVVPVISNSKRENSHAHTKKPKKVPFFATLCIQLFLYIQSETHVLLPATS